MALVLNPGEAANLLSLDGGGIKGISSLVILNAIMDRIREIEDGNNKKLTDDRLPVNYFHLAAGTSTGGIIALMLFRLRMSPKLAIKAYGEVASTIFAKKISGAASYSDIPLKKAIDQIMIDYAPTEDKLSKGEAKLVNNKAKMFMCATLQARGESILLRSYTPPADALPVSENGQNIFKSGVLGTMSISEAARATSAAPTYFPEVKIPIPGADPVVFWDGGVLNNNPIDQLWRARLDLVGLTDPAPKVACVLSLGTSWSKAKAPSLLDSWIPEKSTEGGWFAAAKNVVNSIGSWTKDQIYAYLPVLQPVEKMIPFLTNTEAKHLDFSRYMKRLEKRTAEVDGQTQYFRFNTPTDYYVDMAESAKMKKLAETTETWLKDPNASEYLESCAQLLAKKPKVK